MCIETEQRSALVHLDLKPENILLDPLDNDDRPCVADFGFAAAVSDLHENHDAMGCTVAYASPELVRRYHQRSHAEGVDTRADIWSLGVISYELLTGKQPFVNGSGTEIMEAIERYEPTSPKDLNKGIPDKLNEIVLRCLNKEPNNRYGSAKELADALSTWLGSQAESKSLLPAPGEKKALGVPAGVTCLQFSSDGKVLAIGDETGKITLWSVERGNKLNELRAHDEQVTCLAFHPNEMILASSSRDKRIHLWKVSPEPGETPIQTLGGHENNPVMSLCFSRNGQALFSAQPHAIKSWDWKTGKCRSLLEPQSPLENIRWRVIAASPDGRWIAAAGEGDIHIWTVSSGHSQTIKAHYEESQHEESQPRRIMSLAFRGDGLMLASAGQDRSIRIWDVKNGKEAQPSCPLLGARR